MNIVECVYSDENGKPHIRTFEGRKEDIPEMKRIVLKNFVEQICTHINWETYYNNLLKIANDNQEEINPEWQLLKDAIDAHIYMINKYSMHYAYFTITTHKITNRQHKKKIKDLWKLYGCPI